MSDGADRLTACYSAGMSFDAPSSATPAPVSRQHAPARADEARTLTLRLRSPAPELGAGVEGSVVVAQAHAAVPATLRAGVVPADATPLVLTLR